MAHIDWKADDLKAAVALALRRGAKKPEVRFYDTATVMFGPAGHPFGLSAASQQPFPAAAAAEKKSGEVYSGF